MGDPGNATRYLLDSLSAEREDHDATKRALAALRSAFCAADADALISGGRYALGTCLHCQGLAQEAGNERLRELNRWAENALHELQRFGYRPVTGCWCCVTENHPSPGCNAAREYWSRKAAPAARGAESTETAADTQTGA